MKKITMTVGVVLALTGCLTLNSCIGSFALTNRVLNWNKQVGTKFVNELVFFAFWILPVYEVTSLADLLVINSIEFWSGNNPMEASVKMIDTDQGRYFIDCDGKGYTVTFQPTGESMRLDFMADQQTWALNVDGEMYPFMTFVDDSHVKMITPDGDFRLVDVSEQGVLAYSAMVSGKNLASR